MEGLITKPRTKEEKGAGATGSSRSVLTAFVCAKGADAAAIRATK